MKRNMKRTASFAMALVFLLALLPGAALAADTVAGGKCGTNLTWTLDSAGVLTISGTGEMTESPWRPEHMDDIKKVVIKKGVTNIEDGAFGFCSSMTEITIPDSVTSMGEGTFAKCFALESVTIPNSVTTIGFGLFERCFALESVTIPSSVTTIEGGAFFNCFALADITIPGSVTTIGENAFNGCTALTEVTIPASVTEIGESVFANCSALTAISAASGNSHYCSVNGVLFNKNKTELIDYPAGRQGAYAIPSGVTAIKSGAFVGCSGLTGITIPTSVKSIGAWTFSSCSSLKSVTIPAGVTNIGEYTFSGCSAMTSVTIPSGVTSIGDWAFYDCSSLTSLTIPASVTSFGERAFTGCSGLTSIAIPAGVKSISEYAFSNCSGLKSVTISVGVKDIGYYAFSGCSSLTSVTIPAGVTSIGNCAFFSCDGLKSVTIPASVTSIGKSAFQKCGALTDVYYASDSAAWAKITIDDGNELLKSAKLHFNAGGGDTALAVSSIKADKTSASVGDTITWTASATGGSGTLQYCFYIYKDGAIVKKGSYGSGKTVSWKTTAAGSYTAKVFVKDASGASVNKLSGKTTVGSAAPLAVSSIKADKTTANVGDTITWTAAATGGSGTLQYCFYIYKDGAIVKKGSYGSGKTVSWKTTAAGSYTAKVFVKDASGASVSLLSAQTTVGGAPLAVSSIKADKTTANVGDTITWTAAATGGSGTLQYCFYIYKNGSIVQKGSYGSTKTFSYKATAAGNYSAKVFVKDASGAGVSLLSAQTTVGGAPLAVSSIKADKTSANIGDTITWTATTTGGSGTLQYCFYIYKNGSTVQKGAYGSAKTFSYKVTAAGNYTAKVFVKDASGASVSLLGTQTTVGGAPLAVSSIKADKTSANVGDTITWTASATGGSGTLQYCFYVYKDGKNVYKGSYGSAKTVSWKASAAGTYTAKVFVKDAAGSVSLMSAGTIAS